VTHDHAVSGDYRLIGHRNKIRARSPIGLRDGVAAANLRPAAPAGLRPAGAMPEHYVSRGDRVDGTVLDPGDLGWPSTHPAAFARLTRRPPRRTSSGHKVAYRSHFRRHSSGCYR
jgi:hypothetical protein